jgi:gamma-glutamylcyclotransferase (GGCT)/AIG2-like uncharacterized protein YtfP
MTRVFVYGSLRKFSIPFAQKGHNHSILQDSPFVEQTRTEDKFLMYDLGSFPGCKRSEEGYRITGEVYEVGEGILRDLDILEGNPFFYKRDKVDLISGYSAWMYLYQKDTYHVQQVQGGDWFEHLKLLFHTINSNT